MYIKPNIHYIYPKYPQINLKKKLEKKQLLIFRLIIKIEQVTFQMHGMV